MANILPVDLIKEFVSQTNDSKQEDKTTNLYGTAVVRSNGIFVKLDGSDVETPVSMATDAKTGDRVIVKIENHRAYISENLTSPASGRTATDILKVREDEDGNIIVVDGQLRVAKEFVDELVSKTLTTQDLSAVNAEIESLKAVTAKIDNAEILKATIDKLSAKYASVDHLTTDDLKAINADLKQLKTDFAEIGSLSAGDAEIVNAAIDNLIAKNASFTRLTAEEIKAFTAEFDNLDVKYANIDFTNIGQAAMEYFYSESGLIRDVVVGDETITGHLVGVTINGDLIEGNTVKADKFVILGEDGLYYKLNVNALGEATASSDEKYQNGLDGSAIITKSITATKIAVDDLIAFDATIGGFNIGKDSIYSGVKNSIDNTTRGIYLDNDGQFVFGDADNFISFYKSVDGTYKLLLNASELRFGDNKTLLSDAFDSVNERVDIVKGEIDDLARHVVITPTSVDIVGDDDVSYASYGESSRIGDKDSSHLNLESDGVYLKDGEESLGKFSSISGGKLHIKWSEYYQPDGGTILDSNLNIPVYMKFPLPAFDESFTTENAFYVIENEDGSRETRPFYRFGGMDYTYLSVIGEDLKIDKGYEDVIKVEGENIYLNTSEEQTSLGSGGAFSGMSVENETLYSNKDPDLLEYELSNGYFILTTNGGVYRAEHKVVDFYFDYNISSSYSQLELGGYPSTYPPKLFKVGNGIDRFSASDAMSLDWNGVMEVSGAYNGPTANLNSAFINGTMDYNDFTDKIAPYPLLEQPPEGVKVTIRSATSAFHIVNITFSVQLIATTLGYAGTNPGGQITKGTISYNPYKFQTVGDADWSIPYPTPGSVVTGVSRIGANPVVLELLPSGSWTLYNAGASKITGNPPQVCDISVSYISAAKQYDVPIISAGSSGGGSGVSQKTIRDIIESYGFVTKDKVVKSNTTEGWLSQENSFVPDYDTLIVYLDYYTEGDIDGNTITRPGFKVGDGYHKLADLPFSSAASIKKLSHALNIGTYSYDGSEEVTIPTYAGETE